MEEEEHSLRESVSAYETLVASRNELLELLSVLNAADMLLGKQEQISAPAAVAPPKSKVSVLASWCIVSDVDQGKAKKFTVEDHDPESLNSPLLAPGNRGDKWGVGMFLVASLSRTDVQSRWTWKNTLISDLRCRSSPESLLS